MPIDQSEFVPNVHFEQILIKSLVSNQEYQRNLSLQHVSKTADHFDLYQINPVKVSRRDGVNYVFNGQHTIETVAQASGSRDTPVWCMIYDDLSYEAEADVFANQMKFTKPLTPYEIFVAKVESGSERQLTIKALVDSYSLTMSGSKSSAGCVCAVSALEYIYSTYGYHTLDQTLYASISTWEGDPVSLSANMLKGIAKLIHIYGDNLHIDVFVDRMSRISAREISREANERHNGSLAYAEVLLTYYNKKAKYKLRYNLLIHSPTSSETDDAENIENMKNNLLGRANAAETNRTGENTLEQQTIDLGE